MASVSASGVVSRTKRFDLMLWCAAHGGTRMAGIDAFCLVNVV